MENAKSETKYERLRKIGIGSYGVVFKCVNRQTGQIVAIKRYSENDSDPTIRKIAMREVRMLRQLHHPNLIHLIEVFRRKRILHLVFDYCELTVLDVIEKYTANCPLNLIKKIIWQLVNGVSYCHSHNCIHRDIKPENILINQSGVVKLCDFGFARNLKSNSSSASGGGGSTSRKSSSTRTAAAAATAKRVQYERDAKLLGVVVHNSAAAAQIEDNHSGENDNNNNNQENNYAYLASERQALTEYVATRWYRAPELLVGDIYYDIKIDIWAIGCVTAELMRGEPLWPGKTDLDQLYTIMSSLGPLTASQSHSLLTAGFYDQANTERLLGQQCARVSEPLERRIPTRVGRAGADFVLACLRMDPAHRPTSERLLGHPYIHSAQMSQFVQGASNTAMVTARDSPSRAAAAAAANHHYHYAPPPHMGGRTNSQAILRVANQQQAPASKRLVLAPGATSPSGSSSGASANTSRTSRANDHSGGLVSHHSLVPVPVRNKSRGWPGKPTEQTAVSSRQVQPVRDSSLGKMTTTTTTPSEQLPAAPAPATSLSGMSNKQEGTPAKSIPSGSTRRSSNRYALKQTNENLIGRQKQQQRLSHSQGNLPSAAARPEQQDQQQQQHQQRNKASKSRGQQRVLKTPNDNGHLIVLVEPTKRDRQRTHLDHYGKTRALNQQEQQQQQLLLRASIDRATLAPALSHNAPQ